MQKRLLATTVLALSMFAMARAQAGGGGGANHDRSSRSAAIPLGQLAPPEKRDRHRKGLGSSHLSNSPSLSTRDKTIPGSMVV